MKKYIGTKQVEAEPMTLGDYVKKTGRNPYVNGFLKPPLTVCTLSAEM